jgi:hypothetical protein
MTADRLAGELPAGDARRPGADDAGLPNPNLERTLALCDQVMGEVGRRGHLFTWLRAPGQGNEGWLPVDAYYPRGRLVVLYRARDGSQADLYRELVPARGLRLLELTPADLASTPAGAKRALAQRLGDLPPPRSAEPPATERAPRRMGNPLRRLSLPDRAPASKPPPPPQPPPSTPSSALERGSRFVSARLSAEPPPRMESPMPGIIVGLALVLVLIVAVLYVTSQ